MRVSDLDRGLTPVFRRLQGLLDRPDHVESRIRKAQTLAYSANKPVALLLCRDLMWEEPA